ncbi:hypothetical protein NUW54_g151 [Trametes sanguinea]|uniref:Uncharacterized protein n=2 Tax=Trametes sanguinea TaxID=158606 RepID=A0ACC1QBU3_9APHY|nr:hypothetical protein NUW54_g1668 [Trametes sanguinea]KAJ3019171.1 hypothetical protein NUW54_g151 [Trametes sanguinea]
MHSTHFKHRIGELLSHVFSSIPAVTQNSTERLKIQHQKRKRKCDNTGAALDGAIHAVLFVRRKRIVGRLDSDPAYLQQVQTL